MVAVFNHVCSGNSSLAKLSRFARRRDNKRGQGGGDPGKKKLPRAGETEKGRGGDGDEEGETETGRGGGAKVIFGGAEENPSEEIGGAENFSGGRGERNSDFTFDSHHRWPG